ncbi:MULTISPECIES: alpha/beta fold hydrolase [unclassified Sphingomonas]|uniref:alpha/beta hydrolase family protein n=1 Tax=unclassified Sphingomonas TaxID=196159 RepID=UPI00257AF287|nr:MULTISPECIES: alpha/beta fold hydrolase [unclassified Sphingomonas]
MAFATPAAATVGERHRLIEQPNAALRNADHRPVLRVTIWYPAAAGAQARSIDFPPDSPLFEVGSVAPDATFRDDKRHPVVLLSHGFGGSARMMAWFGLALAELGYVVIAVDHPGNNGVDPATPAGAVLWWDRADDLKAAFAAVLADPALSPHIDRKRLGVAGFSIGGLTALVAGGARTDPERMIRFCRAHPEDGTCKPQLEFGLSNDDAIATLASPALASERARAGADHALPGVRAVFAMAPVVQPLTPASLRAMREPVVIVAGGDDVTVPAATHALVAKALLPNARVEILAGVTHYSFLATCSAAAKASLPVCRDATDQARAHRIAIEQAAALFDRTLR